MPPCIAAGWCQELDEALGTTVHRRGAAAARRALRFANGRSESPGESLIRVMIEEWGFPPPRLQIRIYSPNGTFLGRVDLGYPDLGVLFEFDGAIKYHKPLRPGQDAADVVVKEKLREDRIRDMGYVVVRLVWAELADLTALRSRVAAAVARGRRVVASGGLIGTWSVD